MLLAGLLRGRGQEQHQGHRVTPRQLRDAANGPWGEAEEALRSGCPTCGRELDDMRGVGFNIRQAVAAGRCVLVSDTDYTCAYKHRLHDGSST